MPTNCRWYRYANTCRSKDWGQLLDGIFRKFGLNPVYPAGTNVLKEPKILMYLPFRLLYRDWSECIGAIREDFFAHAMKMTATNFMYLKTKRGAKTPDFLVDHDGSKTVIEIGGKGKGREQFKGVDVKRKVILSHTTEGRKDRKPLCLIGFL